MNDFVPSPGKYISYIKDQGKPQNPKAWSSFDARKTTSKTQNNQPATHTFWQTAALHR
jgi:hypothetical protein